MQRQGTGRFFKCHKLADRLADRLTERSPPGSLISSPTPTYSGMVNVLPKAMGALRIIVSLWLFVIVRITSAHSTPSRPNRVAR